MSEFDLIVRGGTVVIADAVRRADVGVADGKIVAIEPSLAAVAHEVIDATGLHVFPGVIDSHVHFNEPGRAHWEGFATGSSALAVGGGTTFFDMPLNASPPTLDGVSFDLKLAAAVASSHTDFAFWGGLTPGNLDQLDELAQRGVIGFKAFMCASGIEDFPRADDATLREGMKRAAQLKRLVAVHAESDALTRRLAEERVARGQTTVRDFLDSRPIEAELDAIRRALDLAGETGCALHVVHVSCGEGVGLIADARRRGVDVTCETCPHYLVLTETDMEQLGALAKCAPPLRSASAQAELWRRLIAGEVATVGSDHSPSPPELKRGDNFFQVWGGIAGVQHTLPLMLTEGHAQRGLDLPAIARLLAGNVAVRFNLSPRKGAITVGADADLALVDLQREHEIKVQDLWQRHRLSPYAGRMVRGQTRTTILRGRKIFHDGRIGSPPMGRLLTPEAHTL